MRSFREIVRTIKGGVLWTNVSYTLELAQDLKSICGIDAEEELLSIIRMEIKAWCLRRGIKQNYQLVMRRCVDHTTFQPTINIGLQLK
jgi:hypothetical protein